VALAVAVGACVTEVEEPDAALDNTYVEEDIVSERQLFGSELPRGTFVLTFDDGPGPRSAELSEYLASKGISATFFVNGRNVPGRQRVLSDIVQRGHTLANHTQNHVDMRTLSGAPLVRAVADTDEFIAAAQPNGPWLLRAPYGAWNARVASELNRSAMRKYVGSIFWEVGGQLTATAGADWACWGRRLSVDRCAQLYLQEARTKGRGIILIHDVHGKSIDMAKLLVEAMLREGNRFARITDVPSVVRAGATSSQGASGCASATLGRAVSEGSCVQSARDDRWYVCTTRDWELVPSGADTRCTSRPR
jgi:peptidoglycan/xylan/chitin deacetylase (PgdA/CDA1 family)